MLSEDKVNRIKELKKEAPNAFVGGSINDAAALLEDNTVLALAATGA